MNVVWYAKDVEIEPSPENTAEFTARTFLGIAWQYLRNPAFRRAVQADRMRFMRVEGWTEGWSDEQNISE